MYAIRLFASRTTSRSSPTESGRPSPYDASASSSSVLDADFAWTHARFDNGDRIPNSVDRVASVAGTVREIGPWSASLQWRYLGSGALIEDNSARSDATTVVNAQLDAVRLLARRGHVVVRAGVVIGALLEAGFHEAAGGAAIVERHDRDE